MGATIPSSFRGQARRDAAAFCLFQLAKGILSGELAVQAGEHSTALPTAEFLILEIQVKQKKRLSQVEVKLRWPRRPVVRAMTEGGG